MHRSTILAVRSRGIFSIFSKETPAKAMTKESKEQLKSVLSELRTDAPKTKREVESVDFEELTDDMIDKRIDMDSIRARSLMQYRYNYTPPSNVDKLVLQEAKIIFGEKSGRDVASSNLSDNKTKLKLLSSVGEKLKHFPNNSRLHSLKTVQDVVTFYSEPVENINEYTKLARSADLPENVHIMEQPVRFHPEDVDACHGGVTAFPGSGGEVIGLRNKRLLRQFQPKKEWFDYEDQTYDYSRPDKDMPWDPEIANRMDRYPNKRYNLKTKTFTRTA